MKLGKNIFGALVFAVMGVSQFTLAETYKPTGENKTDAKINYEIRQWLNPVVLDTPYVNFEGDSGCESFTLSKRVQSGGIGFRYHIGSDNSEISSFFYDGLFFMKGGDYDENGYKYTENDFARYMDGNSYQNVIVEMDKNTLILQQGAFDPNTVGTYRNNKNYVVTTTLRKNNNGQLVEVSQYSKSKKIDKEWINENGKWIEKIGPVTRESSFKCTAK